MIDGTSTSRDDGGPRSAPDFLAKLHAEQHDRLDLRGEAIGWLHH